MLSMQNMKRLTTKKNNLFLLKSQSQVYLALTLFMLKIETILYFLFCACYDYIYVKQEVTGVKIYE
jgi:hypothetical protein